MYVYLYPPFVCVYVCLCMRMYVCVNVCVHVLYITYVILVCQRSILYVCCWFACLSVCVCLTWVIQFDFSVFCSLLWFCVLFCCNMCVCVLERDMFGIKRSDFKFTVPMCSCTAVYFSKKLFKGKLNTLHVCVPWCVCVFQRMPVAAQQTLLLSCTVTVTVTRGRTFIWNRPLGVCVCMCARFYVCRVAHMFVCIHHEACSLVRVCVCVCWDSGQLLCFL